jgi:hypothetical protein
VVSRGSFVFRLSSRVIGWKKRRKERRKGGKRLSLKRLTAMVTKGAQKRRSEELL